MKSEDSLWFDANTVTLLNLIKAEHAIKIKNNNILKIKLYKNRLIRN